MWLSQAAPSLSAVYASQPGVAVWVHSAVESDVFKP